MNSCSCVCLARMPLTFQVATFTKSMLPGDGRYHTKLMVTRARALVFAAVLLALASTHASTLLQGTGRVTTPAQQFGADVGDDFFLATYTQLEAYWKTLDRESDRMSLVDIGR